MNTFEEVLQFLKEHYPNEVDENGSNVIPLLIRKLTDYNIMSQEVYDAVKITELMNRNTFMIGQWNHLENVLNANSVMLQKKPQDITVMGKIARVQHDLEIIRAAASKINQQIMDLIEKESGKEFKYLPTTKNANKNA